MTTLDPDNITGLEWYGSYYTKDYWAHIPELHRGVNLRAGYTRGVGLEFSEVLKRLYEQQPDFAEARRMVGSATITTDPKIANLFIIIARELANLPHGHIVEFGSYKGGLAVLMALTAKAYLPGVKVFSFDTFAGMPETRPDDLHKQGDFSDSSVEAVQAFADECGADNLVLIPGLFADTAAKALKDIGQVALAHFDADIYQAGVDAYEAVRPHMVSGGYYVWDDPTFSSCIGAMHMVEDYLVRRDGLSAEQVYPHLVYRAPGL